MKIAIITGASAGLGKEFLRQAPAVFPEIDEYWLIARRKEKLLEAATLVKKQCRIFPLDLTEDASYRRLEEELASVRPEVALLENNSGCGYLGNVGEGELYSRIIARNDLLTEDMNTWFEELIAPYEAKRSFFIKLVG